MDSAHSICYLLTLLAIISSSISFSSLDVSQSKPSHSSSFFKDIDYQTKDVQYFIVTRRLSSMSPYPCIRRGKMHTLLYIALLLIATSSDVELNPGPRQPKCPCQICNKAVTWKQKGVACDDCQQWYHSQCMHMNSKIYETLCNYSNISWHCDNCGMPNFSTSLFESFTTDVTSNSFSVLDSPNTTCASSPGPPISSSSPKSSHKKKSTPSFRSLKTLVINFQSCKNKKAEICNLLESADPSIIMGSETWMNPNIHTSEFFPPNYDILRKDRKDGYGGVLLGLKK